MSEYRRLYIPGATVFFTVCLAKPGSSMLVDDIERLRVAVRQTMAERPFEVKAWVVLPDHMHAVWRLPEGDCDYAVRWRLIKSRFSRGVPEGRLRTSHKIRNERGIWQRRYWEHHIRGEAELAETQQYCWHNPVKHGFVERPEDWPYSSYHRDMARP